MEKPLTDPWRWVECHGDLLYRFALRRVGDPHVAEDLVQDTLLAALKSNPRDIDQSFQRSWMMGILKHKIVDYYRKTTRERMHASEQPDSRSPDDDFLANGHWKPEAAARVGWPDNPDSLLERKQFWDALTNCLKTLPSRTVQIFTMREADEVETDEICRLFRLSPSNLYVILHRTRKQLRDCLDSRYFGRTNEVVKS